MSVTLVTNLGAIKVELNCEEVPKVCFNFLALAASGYYDNVHFHRLIPGFMIQGGDPSGKGKGGESIWGGKFEDQFHGDVKHNKRGVLSMANKGPNSNGSQFFFTFASQPHLDNVYCAFGQVVDGFDVLDAMEATPVGKKNRPEVPIVIERIDIHANPLASDAVI
mmetsp:Transcript_4040/g.7079  ORF Transcript_4040/g.7079 Transcript_4040/m.7079 type:complete len:165 (-) Transcript_4040:561-1055(-)